MSSFIISVMPRPGSRTRGNRHVPLSESWFPGTSPKTYIKSRNQKVSNTKNFIENLTEFRL